jgi:predicted nucleotidyltransferase
MDKNTDTRKIAEDFVKACIQKGIPVKSAILFGSCVKGTNNKDSDIDIALIADSFGKNIINNARQTASVIYEYYDVEVHHFSPDEFESDDRFVKEIKKTGIKIY